MISVSIMDDEKVSLDAESSFVGEVSFQYSGRSIRLNPIVSRTGICPVPSYRATYYRNTIIYEIFRICQGWRGDFSKTYF